MLLQTLDGNGSPSSKTSQFPGVGYKSSNDIWLRRTFSKCSLLVGIWTKFGKKLLGNEDRQRQETVDGYIIYVTLIA